MQPNISEKKFRVMFAANVIISGTCYGKGVYSLTADKAKAALLEGGVMSDKDKSDLAKHLDLELQEGSPLSLEETMERFNNMDFSDDVMRSMQYHQDKIKEMKAKSLGDYGDIPLTGESITEVETVEETADNTEEVVAQADLSQSTEDLGTGATIPVNQDVPTDLPEGFPARDELLSQGITTLAKLKSMTKADILKLEKIGDAKANQIGARLAAMADEARQQ